MDKNTHEHIRPIPPMPPFANIPPVDGMPHPIPHRHGKPHNHSARFMPMLLHPHIPHHFNFWCNKIIPLAYDDSLSYYEVIAKTVDYLNNMLNDEKMLAINIEEIAQAFCELQNFVNDYFAFYQSKGLIVYDTAVTSENFSEILPNADEAQMNTMYRIKFVEGATQNITANLPDGAKPYSGKECLLFNVSNFDLKRVGNEWVEVSDDEKSYNTKNNYQLFITDKDIFFRENNGDTWGEWDSIFANWWESTYADVQTWVRELVSGVVDDLTARIEAETARAEAAEEALDDKIEAETARAEAAEEALDDKIEAETTRATNAENALSTRLVAEYERAAQAESDLDDKIDNEISRATSAEQVLSNALSAETTRATTAENNLSAAITAETSRATTAESNLSATITAETGRATTAENNLSSAITAETARATTAENALSSRIDDWETDLADEREDRQQADNTLSAAITAETNRATAAETTLDSKIDAETTRATTAETTLDSKIDTETTRSTAAETTLDNKIDTETARATTAETTLDNKIDTETARATAAETTLDNKIDTETARATAAESTIRNAYIPNAGNDLSSDNTSAFDLSRYNDVSITSTVGDIKIYGSAYYNPSSTPQESQEVATKGDIATAMSGSATQSWVTTQLSGYIPNSGNNINENFTLNRAGFQFKGYGFTTGISIHREKIKLQGYGTDTFIDVGRDTVNTNDIYIHANNNLNVRSKNELYLVTETNHCCYYLKNWTSGGTITADMEIVTKGDINTVVTTITGGYIPNAGNDLSATSGSSLDIKRNDYISLNSDSNITLRFDDTVGLIIDETGSCIYGIDNHNTYIDVGYASSDDITIQYDNQYTVQYNAGGTAIKADTNGVEIMGVDNSDVYLSVGYDDSNAIDITFDSEFNVKSQYGAIIHCDSSGTELLCDSVVMHVGIDPAEFVVGTPSLSKVTLVYYMPITTPNSDYDYEDIIKKEWDKTAYSIITDDNFADVVTSYNNFSLSNGAPTIIKVKDKTLTATATTLGVQAGQACELVFENCVFTAESAVTVIIAYGNVKFINCNFSANVGLQINPDCDVLFENCNFHLNNTVTVRPRVNEQQKCIFDGCAMGNITIGCTESQINLRNIRVKNSFITVLTLETGNDQRNVDNIMICGNRIVTKTVVGDGNITNSSMWNNIEGV